MISNCVGEGKMQSYKRQLSKCLIHLLIMLIAIGGLLYSISCNFSIKDLLVDSSREYIIMFLEICIGIYVTVITLLASQKTKFTVTLTKKELNHKFVILISLGLVVNLITAIVLSVFKSDNTFIFVFEITLCIISIMYFSYFLIILIFMFIYNIEASVEEDKSEHDNASMIITNLEEIRKRIQK